MIGHVFKSIHMTASRMFSRSRKLSSAEKARRLSRRMSSARVILSSRKSTTPSLLRENNPSSIVGYTLAPKKKVNSYDVQHVLQLYVNRAPAFVYYSHDIDSPPNIMALPPGESGLRYEIRVDTFGRQCKLVLKCITTDKSTTLLESQTLNVSFFVKLAPEEHFTNVKHIKRISPTNTQAVSTYVKFKDEPEYY